MNSWRFSSCESETQLSSSLVLISSNVTDGLLNLSCWASFQEALSSPLPLRAGKPLRELRVPPTRFTDREMEVQRNLSKAIVVAVDLGRAWAGWELQCLSSLS